MPARLPSGPPGGRLGRRAPRRLPSSPDDLKRRRLFEAAHPDVTISPPETHASPWTARREGKILAAEYQLGDLLDSLKWLLERQPERVLKVWQPYAWAIVAGVKTTEDCDWKPTRRGHLWFTPRPTTRCPPVRPPAGRPLAMSAILGYVTLVPRRRRPWRVAVGTHRPAPAGRAGHRGARASRHLADGPPAGPAVNHHAEAGPAERPRGQLRTATPRVEASCPCPGFSGQRRYQGPGPFPITWSRRSS